VWLSDGELKVLFECKDDLNDSTNLLSTDIKYISNKDLVQEYLDHTEFIPHLKRIVTMEPTTGISVFNQH